MIKDNPKYEQQLAEKKANIELLTKQQHIHIKRLDKILKRNESKKFGVIYKRLMECFKEVMTIKQIEFQKNIIRSHPVQKKIYPQGGIKHK